MLAGTGDITVIEAILGEGVVELPGGKVAQVVSGKDKDRSNVLIGESPEGELVYAYQVGNLKTR